MQPAADWIDCQLLRRVGQRSCIVRLIGTGAIVQIGLLESLDAGKSAMATALQPIPAQVCFSEKGLDDCKLEVDWRQLGVCMPPPVRFQCRARNFKTIQRTKRRRLGE